MSLHPYIQLQVGAPPSGTPITTIPPEYIISGTYKSAAFGLDTFDFEVVDPTYQRLEDLLILSDTSNLPLYARFGYLDDLDQISSKWMQLRLLNYVPRLSERGTEITASTMVDLNEQTVILQNKTYEGKISRVVEQIAEDLEVDVELEETDDDDNEFLEVDAVGNTGPKKWSTRNMDLYKFIKSELQPKARAISGASNYITYFTGTNDATRRPVLHFHSLNYPYCTERTKGQREFTYLLGRQGEVIEFAPEYNSSLLGKVGSGGLVMRYYDPRTGQYVSRNNNIVTNNDETGVGESQTNAPVVTTDPIDDTLSAGIAAVRENTVKEATDRARQMWSTLYAASFKASMTLVGLPELSDLEANEVINMRVLIPGSDGADPFRTHWSSGRWLCTEAIHNVGTQYTISCQLQRDSSSEGISEALASWNRNE